jgi:hypothetical protein
MFSKANALRVVGFLGISLLGISSLALRRARADDLNKRAEFQFQTPVEVSGKVLAPGNYVFQLVETSDLNVVQILREDTGGRETLVKTVATSPEYRRVAPGRPVINLERAHSGREVIHSWYYAGENWGWKFNYPAGKE